nr:hypothetical protein [Haemoproteus tartakovskyi]
MNIYLTSKLNKTKYKIYKIILNYKKNNKYNIFKFGIYNAKFNIFSCIYIYLLKYLKQGYILTKNLINLIYYFIKYKKNK